MSVCASSPSWLERALCVATYSYRHQTVSLGIFDFHAEVRPVKSVIPRATTYRPPAQQHIWPLTQWYHCFAAIALYLLSLSALKRVMRWLPASVPGESVLRLASVVHNIVMFLISCVLAAGFAHEVYWHWDSVPGMFCDERHHLVRSSVMFWVYVAYLSKMYEFLDTVLLVVKRREPRFLQVYHHCLTVVLAWLALYDSAPLSWVALLQNSLVHVAMYYYYTQASLGHRVWWKRYLTVAQMIQFWINLLGMLFWLYLKMYVGRPCTGSVYSWAVCVWGNATFFVLFQWFYSEAYKSKAKKKNKKKD